MLNKVLVVISVFLLTLILAGYSTVFSQEVWETFDSSKSGFKGDRVQGITIDSKGNKWFCTKTAGVNVFDGSNWVNYTTVDGLVNDNVYVVAIDSKENKWFGTNGGVTLFDGTDWTNTTAPSIAHDKVNSVAIDLQGNVWLATKEGISKFDGQTWTNFGADVLGIGFDYTQAVIVDLSGNIWFGTTGGILMHDGANWIHYGIPEGVPEGNISVSSNSAAVDWNGHLWFGTESGGALKYDGSSWTRYDSTNSGLKNHRIRHIAVDTANHVIWFAHLISGEIEGGASKYNCDTDTWTIYQAAEGNLANGQVRAIAVESNGDIWFGTEAGISVLRVSTGLEPDRSVITSDFKLLQNYPNPFNPETEIRYKLPKSCRISFTVYDLSGRIVRILVNDEFQNAGTNVVKWDGKNALGEKVTSGLYFYSIRAGDFTQTKGMMLLR